MLQDYCCLHKKAKGAIVFAIKMVQKNIYVSCYLKDKETLRFQLRIEQRGGRVFVGWTEGNIYFPPTYKYSNNSDKYAGDDMNQKEKRRTPAWYFFLKFDYLCRTLTTSQEVTSVNLWHAGATVSYGTEQASVNCHTYEVSLAFRTIDLSTASSARKWNQSIIAGSRR